MRVRGQPKVTCEKAVFSQVNEDVTCGRMSQSAPFEHEIEGELRRRCAKRRCPEPARAGGSLRGALCAAHHAGAMRAWRARRRAAGQPIAGASRTAPSSASEPVRARQRLSRALRRGEVVPGPCAACSRHERVVAAHPDTTEPGKTVWACRCCRFLLVRGIKERERDRERDVEVQRERVAFAELCAKVVALVAALPPDVAAALDEAASRGGPLGRLRAPQPAYTQNLARAYQKWLAR